MRRYKLQLLLPSNIEHIYQIILPPNRKLIPIGMESRTHDRIRGIELIDSLARPQIPYHSLAA